MRSNSVILLDSNQGTLEQLVSVIRESKDFQLLHAGEDGDAGIKALLSNKPDVILVSMFLKGTDGCAVIRAAKKTWADVKIIATGVAKTI